ncbi:MAG: hypothetical protein OES32_18065 [Acidobacteriota bacterium]|nr:hypothetical protein [Acidobacteriota bacterium]MDH3525483.1 hypothetical protein [Acidobacteriota bacterium]
MRPATSRRRATTPDGAELILTARDGVFTLRVGGWELMTSRAHGSEEELARLACAAVAGRERPRVLVAGLGFGYTLRAALDHLVADASVTVCEVFDCLLAWNRGDLGVLAGRPLEDRRVRAVHADVIDLLAAADPFDVILLDVDNGPQALTLRGNERLYDRAGATLLRDRLTPGGALAVWSAGPAPVFTGLLGQAGLEVTARKVPLPGAGRGSAHHLLLARRP